MGNGETEAIPDLEVLLHNRQYTSVQSCAAGALVRLGEIAPPSASTPRPPEGRTPTFATWRSSTSARSGPRRPPAALSFLSEALHSPQWDTRYLAVRSRAQLGPTARAVLEEARSDPQQEVRELATRALAGGS